MTKEKAEHWRAENAARNVLEILDIHNFPIHIGANQPMIVDDRKIIATTYSYLQKRGLSINDAIKNLGSRDGVSIVRGDIYLILLTTT